jgi:predicted peptidase
MPSIHIAWIPSRRVNTLNELMLQMLRLSRPRLIFLLPLLISAAFFSHRLWAERKPYLKHTVFSSTFNGTRDYAVILPDRYDDSEGPWPTILYLHGWGEVGTDLSYLLRRGLVKEVQDGLDIPFIIVAPQAMWTDHYADGWKRNEQEVLAVVADAQSRYRIDPDRIYLTGNSMGGIGSFYFASNYPDLFAAVAPIAGQGETEWVKGFALLPFWVFHGAKDDVIPVEGSQLMVEAMRAAAVDVKYTEYPDLLHDTWTPTYQNLDLYDWFLEHRRGDPS